MLHEDSQFKKNNSIDERSLPEIWSSCPPAAQEGLRARLMSRLECSTVTVWNWTTGKTTPTSIVVQKEIAKVVKAALGINVSHETLFPAK